MFPVFLLTLGVLVWCILEFLNGIFPLFYILGKGFRWILGACTGRKRATSVIQPGKKMRSRWALSLFLWSLVRSWFQEAPSACHFVCHSSAQMPELLNHEI